MRNFSIAALSSLALIGAAAATATAPAAFAAPAPAAAARLNPNTATEAQLRAAGLAAPVVADVLRARPFASPTAFAAVAGKGLSPDEAKALYEKVFVPLNLNTASREDIMLVPGMTPRMAREFLEYRPYSSMDQFNKEIGKYVPPAEVARLASYVTLR